MSTLYLLGADVEHRVLTQDEAIAVVRAADGYAVTEADVLVACQVAWRMLGKGADVFVFTRLVLVAAECSGGRTRKSPWWLAADLFVFTSMRSLGMLPDGGRLAEARSVVDEQIALLRKGLRRRLPGTARAERRELADTLRAAALLLISPYRVNVSDAQPGSLGRWMFERAQVDLRRPEEAARRAMPPTADAATEAMAYLNQAYAVARGHLRGLCLASMMDVLEVLMVTEPESREKFAAVRTRMAARAYGLLDFTQDPLDYLDVVIEVVRAGKLPPEVPFQRLLPVPPQELAARYGTADALSHIVRILDGTHRGTLTGVLWDEAVRLAASAGWPSSGTFWNVAVHHFPENRLDCPDAPVDVDAVKARVEQGLASGELTSREAAATLAHAVAHASQGQERQAVDVLDHLGAVDGDFTEEYAQPLGYLAITLAIRGGEVLLAEGNPLGASLLYLIVSGDPLDRVGVWVLGAELVQLSLRALDQAHASTPEELSATFCTALFVADTILPRVGAGAYENRAEFMYLVGQHFDQVMAGRMGEVVADFVLHNHCLFKGNDFGLLLGQPGPRRLDAAAEQALSEIDQAQQRSGPYRPGTGEVFHEFSGSGLDLLCYASLDEAELADSPWGELANRRRSFDAGLTRTMMEAANEQQIRRHALGVNLGDIRYLQEKIPPDTVLISLYLGSQGDDGAPSADVRARLTAVMITSDSHQAVVTNLNAKGAITRVVAPASEGGRAFTLHEMAWIVADLRDAVNADPLHREVSPHAAGVLGGHYTKLGGPPRFLLDTWRAQGKTHLCFWPHGPLHYVPIHLLRPDGRPLADDWTVTILPSVSQLTRPPAESGGTGTLVAAGVNDGGAAFGLPEQPEVEPHVREVANVFAPHPVVLVGHDATPARLLEAMAGARYVYIATHGSNDVEAAWFQCLYLHPDAENDGRLFAHDVLRADLRGVDLIGLSACETALGRFDLNDNLRGLPAALLLAGVSTVVGTLWPVAPQVATSFFAALFLQLSSGRPKREAFRHAQLATREAFRAYRDWGAFVLMGDWR
ncbi:CHAT domain-containing protein [Streptomyces sp. NBC_01565]|uniref:CHAT domain-containing protein n=1 Tax=unclassified Streptomyces TaxID=2593676 RepID=UPI002255882B|nr:CHAT domain-containing protein [Streptomyces sp. NBC_01565]MCX4545715.1 CHAT domain-containing protein [Streptomyces sp. NBC_01565]